MIWIPPPHLCKKRSYSRRLAPLSCSCRRARPRYCSVPQIIYKVSRCLENNFEKVGGEGGSWTIVLGWILFMFSDFITLLICFSTIRIIKVWWDGKINKHFFCEASHPRPACKLFTFNSYNLNHDFIQRKTMSSFLSCYMRFELHIKNTILHKKKIVFEKSFFLVQTFKW